MQANKMRMTNKKRKAGIFLVTGVLVIMFCFLVSAIGVGSPYSGSEVPLKMYPGEEKVVLLNLQNPDIEDEITLEGTMLEGSEIASLEEGTFKVAHKATDVFVELTVRVPAGASIDEIYNVRYEFRQVAGGEEEGGMVSFSQGIKRRFDVVVIEKPEESPEEVSAGWIVLAIVLIVIVIAIIWFIVKSRKEVSGEVVKPVKK